MCYSRSNTSTTPYTNPHLRQHTKKELNAIDHLLMEAKQGAENQCQKFKNGQVQWCLQVTMAININLFWKSILKLETGGKVGLLLLWTQAQKAKIDTVPYPDDYPIETMHKIISKVYKHFNWLKLDENRCNTWMAQLISVQAMAWNKKKKALWQQIRRTEKICKTALVVQKAQDKSVIHWPLSLVIAPKPISGTWKEHHQKSDLEHAHLDEAGHQFTQTGTMPFLTPPLINIFGEAGINKEAKQVLEGTFTAPSNCDLHATNLLSALTHPQFIMDIPAQTTMDYCKGWQWAHKTTSSSALGIYFGHYIVGTFNLEILVVNSTMADIPLQTGFSYNRWWQGLNIMLEKTAGDFNVEKLHIILLFETNFNVINKWIRWAIMFWAKDAHLLAEEQFGSRKYKLAIHQCLNKQLFYNLVWFGDDQQCSVLMTPKAVMTTSPY